MTTLNPTDSGVTERLEPANAPERVALWICCHCQTPRTVGLTVCEHCHKRLHDTVEYVRASVAAPRADILDALKLVATTLHERIHNYRPVGDCLNFPCGKVNAVIDTATSSPVAPSTTQAGEVSAAPVVDDAEDRAWEQQSAISAIAYEFMRLFGVTPKHGKTYDEMRPLFDAARKIVTRTYPVLIDLHTTNTNSAAAPLAAPVGDDERDTLIYWLLRAYQSGHREGWEPSASTDETMDGICSVLANRGYDPNLSDAAKELLKQKPRY